VAFDGTNFLIAWERHDNDGTPQSYGILGARVAPSGTVLKDSLSVSAAGEAQTYPQVACDGANCLVIWVDRRSYPGESYSFSPGPGDIYGTRVSGSDTLLDGPADTGGLQIATGITANAGYPALAFTGGSYLAAWTRGSFVNNPGGPTGIYLKRIAPDGTVASSAAAAGVALSGPPVEATRLFFVSMAGGTNSALVSWLNNIETVDTTKSISGAVVYPTASY
jgi:hypothetical protein